MKTPTDVRNEINRLAIDKALAEEAHKRRKVSKLQNQIDQLRFLYLYLETSPSDETILRMRDKCVRDLEIIESRLKTWMAGRSGDVKALKLQYNTMMGVPILKNKIKALNYLCS